MLVIVFGLAASGKNYVSEVLARHYGFRHIDADQWLTEEMIKCIANRQFSTPEMRFKYTQNIINNIASLLESGEKNLVISQALYKEENRQQLAAAYPNAVFLQIEASVENIKRRLEERDDWIDFEYAKAIMKSFEPMPNYIIIQNNESGEEQLLTQLKKVNLFDGA
jgi:gluconokinase